MNLIASQQPEPKRAAALFKELQLIYGSKLQKAWEGVELKDVLEYWEKAIAEYNDAEIRKAVRHFREYVDFPPTLPEFLRACREFNRVAI